MKCVLCKHGTTNPGNVAVTLERDNCIIISKTYQPIFVKTVANIISVKVSLNRFYPVRKGQSIVIPKSKSSALPPNP
jgi:hypothetical protein